MPKSLSDLEKKVTEDKNRAKAKVALLVAQLAENPGYVLASADSLFEEAAVLEVSEAYLAQIALGHAANMSRGEIMDSITNDIKMKHMYRSLHPVYSSSNCARLYSQQMAVVYARLVDFLK